MAGEERSASRGPQPPILLATRSAGKVAELRALCADAGRDVRTLAELGIAVDPAEDEIEVHATFEENALAKARHFVDRLRAQGMTDEIDVLAEDSGLAVDALGGSPGVHSKRWAGLGATLSGRALDDANNAALARALDGVRDRRARYRCVAVLMRAGPPGDATRVHIASGSCEGRILEHARGDGGFGYDPWFLSDELGRTFAEATGSEKARVSHRGRAIRALLECGGREPCERCARDAR